MATNNTHGARVQVLVMYKECLHNHAAPLRGRGYVLDGCGLFEASGPNGTHAAMVCAACRCHRNFHRRVEVDLPRRDETQMEITQSPSRPQVTSRMGGSEPSPAMRMHEMSQPHRSPNVTVQGSSGPKQEMETGHRRRLTGACTR